LSSSSINPISWNPFLVLLITSTVIRYFSLGLIIKLLFAKMHPWLGFLKINSPSSFREKRNCLVRISDLILWAQNILKSRDFSQILKTFLSITDNSVPDLSQYLIFIHWIRIALLLNHLYPTQFFYISLQMLLWNLD